MLIQPLSKEQLPAFEAYLIDHISDNGKDGTPMFLPIERCPTQLPEGLRKSLQTSHEIPVGELGWRRWLVACNDNGDVIGHIDLGGLQKKFTSHRAMLGMGVHREHRRIGLGGKLIQAAIEWAIAETQIEYIDLLVLTINIKALNLYKKMGFQEFGRHEDKFRIDGESLTTIMMTKKLNRWLGL